MAATNSIAPRCCGVAGVFVGLVAKKGRGGPRPNSGGKRDGAGRKPSEAALFARSFVGPPDPKWCNECGAGFYTPRARKCEACRSKPARSKPACDHEKPLFSNGRRRKSCYVCSPRQIKDGGRAPHRKLSTRAAVCAECGSKYEQWMPFTRYCSSSCRRAAEARRLRDEWLVRKEQRASAREIRLCVCCGDSFRVGLRTLCCSESCSAEYERKRRSGHTHAKRARKFGCVYENVDRNRVFDRDGWRCQLCGVKVNKQTAELDHIVPMSLGGPHTYENTQCACGPCNRAKGARPIGQLHLGLAA